MPRYIAQRLLAGLLTAFIVSLTLFTIIRVIPDVAPGWTDRVYHQPIIILCWYDCDFNSEYIKEVRRDFGLDQPPLHVQYLHWTGSWVTGRWGESRYSPENITRPWMTAWTYGKDTFEAFSRKLPATLQLVVMAQTLAALLGVPAGVIMAIKRDSRTDRVGRAIAKSGLAIHVVWGAPLLLLGGFLLADWSPPIVYVPFLEDPPGNLNQFIFPALALGYAACAAITLMIRSSALGILRQDHIQSYPISEPGYSLAIFLHTLKYALVPATIALVLTFPATLSGVLIVEPIFGLEGVGDMLVKATASEDFPIIESLALFFAVWVIAVNTLVDILCGWLDPEARSTRKSPREEWNHLANPVRLV